MLSRQRFQHDVVLVLVDNGSRPLVNFEILSQPARDYDLALCCERYRIGLC